MKLDMLFVLNNTLIILSLGSNNLLVTEKNVYKQVLQGVHMNIMNYPLLTS